MEALTLGWGLVQGLTTNAHDFWLALKGFISMAFHHKLLELTDAQAPTLVAALKQVMRIIPPVTGIQISILCSAVCMMRGGVISRLPLS